MAGTQLNMPNGLDSASTTIVVDADQGIHAAPFYCTFETGETIKVTSGGGHTGQWTVARGQLSSTATAHKNGERLTVSISREHTLALAAGDGPYPGVTSPGSGKLAMPGGITVGAGGAFSQFLGSLQITSDQTDYSNGQPPLTASQHATLDADDGDMQYCYADRYVDRAGQVIHNPVFVVSARDASGGAHPVPATEPVFQTTSSRNKSVTDYANGSVVADGGIGAYGTTPPASRPTLTLAVSTITDVDAQAAINALIGLINGCGFASVATT